MGDIYKRVLDLIPDHTTIARFRAVPAEALADLSTLVLAVCAQVGVVKVGTIAVEARR